MNINESKTQRQLEFLAHWSANKKKGTLLAPTGFGKSRCGCIAANMAVKAYKDKPNIGIPVTIVVPTDALKQQWQASINAFLGDNASFVVIHTIQYIVMHKKKFSSGLIILDELHRFAAETFKQIFDLIDYRTIMGLTARIERSDGMHVLLEHYSPVIDTITISEAIAKKWVSPYVQVNVGIEMNDQDQEDYDVINKRFNQLFAYFNRDFDTMMSCLGGEGMRSKMPAGGPGSYWREKIARMNGWKPEMGDGHPNSPNGVYRKAITCNRAIMDRKTMLYNHKKKLVALQHIYDLNPNGKFIHFCMSVDFAEQAKELVGGVIYHSSLPTEIRLNGKTIGKAVTVNIRKKNVTKYKVGDHNKLLTWDEVKRLVPGAKRVSKDKLRDEAIEKFSSGEENILHAIKALDEGLDVPNIDCAVITSGTQSPTQNIQRRGRAIRFIEGKVAFIFNVYIRDTQEEKWLSNRQEDSRVIDCDYTDIHYEEEEFEISKRVTI